MKKSTIFFGIMAITLMATAAFGATVLAAGGKGMGAQFAKGFKTQPTATQNTERQAQEKAIQDALASGNYSSWLTAVKARQASAPTVTQEQFTAMSKQANDRKAKTDAVNAALVAGNYDAWKIAEMAVNANSPLLTKITAANFARYAESYKLSLQVQAIHKELGLAGGQGNGLGQGAGLGCQKAAGGGCPMAGQGNRGGCAHGANR